jgi:hypothetical protein
MSRPMSHCPEDAILIMLGRVERRLIPRHQTSKVATILLQKRSGVICTISNISPAGALLLVDNAQTLPDEFDLQL